MIDQTRALVISSKIPSGDGFGQLAAAHLHMHDTPGDCIEVAGGIQMIPLAQVLDVCIVS